MAAEGAVSALGPPAAGRAEAGSPGTTAVFDGRISGAAGPGERAGARGGTAPREPLDKPAEPPLPPAATPMGPVSALDAVWPRFA